jgi:hypothetical protein
VRSFRFCSQHSETIQKKDAILVWMTMKWYIEWVRGKDGGARSLGVLGEAEGRHGDEHAKGEAEKEGRNLATQSRHGLELLDGWLEWEGSSEERNTKHEAVE